MIAIFNITANDKVVMLFPNEHVKDNIIDKDDIFVFPHKGSAVNLVVRNLPDHERDAEAVFLVAIDIKYGRDLGKMFKPLKSMIFSEFFKIYSEISDFSENIILPYEVVGK